MTAAAIIEKVIAEGVLLSLSATGNIKASGDESAIEKWLPTIREHKPEIIEALLEAANDSHEIVDTSSDDRRACCQCQRLRGRVCSIAKPGGLVSANVGYRPAPDSLQRCAGYLPNVTDTNQQSGGERWPGMIQEVSK